MGRNKSIVQVSLSLTETVLTQCGLGKERLELLREADDRVTKILLEKNTFSPSFFKDKWYIPVFIRFYLDKFFFFHPSGLNDIFYIL